LVYGFSVQNQDEVTMFRDGGVCTKNRVTMQKLLQSFLRVEHVSPEETKKLDATCRGLLGQFSWFELMAIHRKGKLTPAVHFEQDVFILWDTLEIRGKTIGGYFLLIPYHRSMYEIEQAGLRRALKQINRQDQGRFFTVLIPLVKASRTVKPLLPAAFLRHPLSRPLLPIIRNYRRHPAPFPSGQLSIPAPSVWVMREFLELEQAYEVWVCSPPPSQPLSPARALEFSVLVLVFCGWGGLFARLLIMNKPIEVSMQGWFIGFFLLVGAFPVSGLYLVGSVQIETSLSRQVQEAHQGVLERFEQYDSDSGFIQNKIQDACNEFFENPAWTALCKSPDPRDVQKAGRALSRGFSRLGLPTPWMFRFNANLPQAELFKITGKTTERERSIAEMYSPLVRNSIKSFSPSQKLAIHVPESQEKILKGIYNSSMEDNKSIGFDVSMAHGQADRIHYFEESVFSFSDFLAATREIVTFVTIRLNVRAVLLGLFEETFRNLSRRQPFDLFAIGTMGDSAFTPVFPRADSQFWRARNPVQAGRLREVMEHTARTRSTKAVFDAKHTLLAVSYPCRHADGFLMGACLDLREMYGKAARERGLLIAGTGFLGFVILILGLTLTRHLLTPLRDVQAALEKVSQGNLDVKLGLSRKDELGDMARSFDQMIQGLQKRRAMGAFVSNTLNQELSRHQSGDVGKPAYRVAAILCSDLRGFTTISESHPEPDVILMLNRHLKEMAEIIQSCNGEVDKFIGDAVIAFFMEETPYGTVNKALEAAWSMRQAHDALQRERAAAGLFTYEIGIGIDFGQVMVGTLTSAGRQEWTIIGKPRLNAEHLEGLSKKGTQTRIIVSPEVKLLTSGWSFTPLDAPGAFELNPPEVAP
jgi:class 3 adenylate cyclase